MTYSFKQFLVEDAKMRASTKRIADMINAATSGKYNAAVSNKTGNLNPVLAITTTDGKIPADVENIFKQHKIGMGDKESINTNDNKVTLKFPIVEL